MRTMKQQSHVLKEVKEVKEAEEVEEVKVRAVEWPVKEEAEAEDVKVRAVEWIGDEAGPAAGGGKRRRVKRERGEDGAAEAGPSGRGADGQGPWNAGRGVSRFRGVGKITGRKAKPWKAQIQVTEDGKSRQIHIGTFVQEEDAARARDRVSIACCGHAEAKTNFPVGEYRAEWAELEAMGVDGAALRERQRAKLLDPLLTAVHL